MPPHRPSKPVDFVGDSLDVLSSLPCAAKRQIGYQLRLLQEGLMPEDYKPMSSVGSGVYEIRVNIEGDKFRAFYVAKFDEAIYVLHVFHKKKQKTPPEDLDKGRKRFATVIRERKA